MNLPEGLVVLLRQPYPWYRGRDQVRVILTISADRIRGMG